MSWLWAVIVEPFLLPVAKWGSSIVVESLGSILKSKVEKTVENIPENLPSLGKADAKPESTELPAHFMQTMAGTMKLGERAVFDLDALEYDDADRKAWINPAAIPKAITPGDYLLKMSGIPILQLERMPDGFKVDLRSARGTTWTPESKDKLVGWLPVTGFITWDNEPPSSGKP